MTESYLHGAQIPEILETEILERAADLLRTYERFEFRRVVDWNPLALHIQEARGYVNHNLNHEFMERLRHETVSTQKRPFKKLLKAIVDEAAVQIGFPRTAHENFPNTFAYAPVSR